MIYFLIVLFIIYFGGKLLSLLFRLLWTIIDYISDFINGIRIYLRNKFKNSNYSIRTHYTNYNTYDSNINSNYEASDYHYDYDNDSIYSNKYTTNNSSSSVYSVKKYLTNNEKEFYNILLQLPNNYIVYPQVNLASIINKNDDNPWHNELFRNIDFGIFDRNYNVLLLIELNDSSHYRKDRIERDEKVKKILKEANIPLLPFTAYYHYDNDEVISTVLSAIESN